MISTISTTSTKPRMVIGPTLVRVFTGCMTGEADNLTSYRPMLPVSYCFDYLVSHLNPIGYHITNLVLFAGCSVLTALLGHELSARYRTGTRLAIMLSSGLLFAVYPLHPEAVAWIVGRVDMLCSNLLFQFHLPLYDSQTPRRKSSQDCVPGSAFSFLYQAKRWQLRCRLFSCCSSSFFPYRKHTTKATHSNSVCLTSFRSG